MWRITATGTREFALGKENWAAAAEAALGCSGFTMDVDEEVISDEARSCYNCRYRRWSATSFTCQRVC